MAASIFSAEYERIFKKTWPPITGAVLLAVASIYMYMFMRPWGVYDGIVNWGDNVFAALGLIEGPITPPMQFSTSISCIGLFAGAVVAALLASKGGIHLVRPRDYAFGIVGGALMGFGGTLARGCNVGGFYTSFAAFSAAAPLMMIGLFAGAYLGTHFYLFDLGNHPRPPAGYSSKSFFAGATSKKIQPLLGLGLLVALLFWALSDDFDVSYEGISAKRGLFFLIAAFMGFVMHRSHFCFARAFREPFMSGDGKMSRAVAVSLLLVFMGGLMIKGTDLEDLRYASFFVNPSVWAGSLVGGLIFGFGMVVAGGCASGSIWRAAEGQIRLILALVAFALVSAATQRWLAAEDLMGLLGKAVFIPDLMGWGLGIALFLAIPVVWYFLTLYNEKHNTFVID
ncbi:MAG: YeeE/YedE thiosulfate transporter family protein [bacterium]|nr:YeeE/YedE thiosulfate transporter family protein [bacterium]